MVRRARKPRVAPWRGGVIRRVEWQRAGKGARHGEIGRWAREQLACSWLFLRKAALKKRRGRLDFSRREVRPRVEHEQVVAGAASRFMEKRQRAAVRWRRASHRPAGHWVAGVVHWDGGLSCPPPLLHRPG